MQDYLLAMQRDANPYIWGAVVGLIAATIVALAQVFGTYVPPNPWLATAGSAGAGGFVIGYGLAAFKNWSMGD